MSHPDQLAPLVPDPRSDRLVDGAPEFDAELDGEEAGTARRRRTSGVSAGLAMLAVALTGVVVSAMAERTAPEPDRSVGGEEPLSTGQVMQLCEEQMADLGLEQYSIPDYVPAPDGRSGNIQARRPWRPGTTVKVMPFGPDDVKERFAAANGRRVAECTIP